jgi:drug/metabolite transporter (DMT)-like permease
LGEAMSATELIGGLTILASVALFARVSAKPEAKRNAQNSAL